ncbi:hypothetical protein KC19_2G047700 [Ceratodon purpureus]|uniref:Uncharacterized protein n=1 Tax=Ceratodon purpureus TaxID=3225 RepID=A0A8T0IQ90_CERPU|nr:hypothetical protein KC19_2G047700 [Ceratodon purpureus]
MLCCSSMLTVSRSTPPSSPSAGSHGLVSSSTVSMCNSDASFVGSDGLLSNVTNSCRSFVHVVKQVLESTYLRIPLPRLSAGFLDGKKERIASLLSAAAKLSLCASVGKTVLEPRCSRIPLGLSAGIMDGDTGSGKLLTVRRGDVDSECF